MRHRTSDTLDEWLRPLFDELSRSEQRKFLSPHPNDEHGTEIQEVIMGDLQQMNDEGKSDDEIFHRLQEHANTKWP